MQFEIWKSASNNNWYWRLRASNNYIIANGEGYTNKSDCEHVVAIIKGAAASAPIKYL